MPPSHSPATPCLTRAEIVEHGQSLPPAPRIMSRLGEMLRDVDTDIFDLAKVLKTDPALTARVIRMSKAIMFGGVTEIADVEHALARVGFSNVLGLVGAASITQLAPDPLRFYGIEVNTFQRCSLCHALAAESLARAIGEDSQAAYLAGLLRGIGMIVLDRVAVERDWIVEGETFSQSAEVCYADYERRLFGYTSAEATRILLEEWQFPDAIVNAVDLHHLSTPEAVEDRLACMLNVAGEIAATSGNGFPGDERHWTSTPEKYDVLGISFEFWQRLCDETRVLFSKACQVLQMN